MNPALCLSYLVSIAAIIGAPVGLAVYIRRSLGAPWRHLGFGGLVFLGSQLVRLPLLGLLSHLMDSRSLAWVGILAVTAGFFEETGRYLGYRYLIPRARDWRGGVMYGLGHGGLEALAVALQMGLVLYTLSAYGRLDTSVIAFSPRELADIAGAQRWWLPLAGAFERLAMLPIHIAFSLTVLLAFLRRNRAWLGLTILAHSAVNLIIVLTLEHTGIVYAELLAALFAVMAVYTILRFRRIDTRAQTR